MIIETGDMWSIYDRTDLFCITTNATIKRDGTLVMGRGLALQARDKIQGLDRAFGEAIGNDRHHKEYGFITVGAFAAFQVKYHFKAQAELRLIRRSTIDMFEWIVYTTAMLERDIRVDLNYPGIGFGGLKESEVYPIIKYLPDCVHVWKYA